MKTFQEWIKENYDFADDYDPSNQIMTDDDMLRVAKQHSFKANKNPKGGVDIHIPWSKRTNDPSNPLEHGHIIKNVKNKQQLRDALGY